LGAVAELDDALLCLVEELLALSLQLDALLVEGEGLFERELTLFEGPNALFQLAEGLLEGTRPLWLGAAVCLAVCAHSISEDPPHR